MTKGTTGVVSSLSSLPLLRKIHVRVAPELSRFGSVCKRVSQMEQGSWRQRGWELDPGIGNSTFRRLFPAANEAQLARPPAHGSVRPVTRAFCAGHARESEGGAQDAMVSPTLSPETSPPHTSSSWARIFQGMWNEITIRQWPWGASRGLNSFLR